MLCGFFRHWHWPIPSLTDRSENCRMYAIVRQSLHIINKYKKYIYFARNKRKTHPFCFAVLLYVFVWVCARHLYGSRSRCSLFAHTRCTDNRSILSYIFLVILTASYLFSEHIIFISLSSLLQMYDWGYEAPFHACTLCIFDENMIRYGMVIITNGLCYF